VLLGTICRLAILPIRPVIDASNLAAQWLLTRLLQKLAEDFRDRGKLDLSESFIDASFSGVITFVAPPFAGNTTQRISSGWFNSLALRSS
jgi:hypothetical protein